MSEYRMKNGNVKGGSKVAIIRIDHETVEVVKVESGKVYLRVEESYRHDPTWLAYGDEQEGGLIRWIDGKYLRMTNRAVSLVR
jgi:hypothetical protein